MTDFISEREQNSIEDLLRRKAELQEINSGLQARVQDGEEIKTQLNEARRDSHKLLHHREKLKNRLEQRSQDPQNQEADIEQHNKEHSQNTTSRETAESLSTATSEIQPKDEDSSKEAIVPLRRALNALRVENASLVKEKRKTEEQRDNLVQELADLNTKHENIQCLCTKLKEEIERLSTFMGKNATEKSDEKEDIELLKAQLRLYQEEIKGMQAQMVILEKSNQRLRTDLNESRAVIRDLRKAPPTFEVYPAVYHPIYRTYADGRYGYEGLDHPLARSASGGYLAPMQKEFPHRSRSEPLRRQNRFKPDLTAVVDREVEDSSLISSNSY